VKWNKEEIASSSQFLIVPTVNRRRPFPQWGFYFQMSSTLSFAAQMLVIAHHVQTPLIVPLI
jgi:hypothetical protein